MPLLNDDIERIAKLGFDKSQFIDELDGWLQLKNIEGRCVFHDGRKCNIYGNRPEGCRSYPVIYDDDAGCARLDDDCPHRNQFRLSKSNRETVVRLVSKMENERMQRGTKRR
jgi:hypothetical protein